jgi:hypothetical protein
MSSEQKPPSARAKGSRTSRKIVRGSDSDTQIEQLRAPESLPTLRKIQKLQNDPNPKNEHSAEPSESLLLR